MTFLMEDSFKLSEAAALAEAAAQLLDKAAQRVREVKTRPIIRSHIDPIRTFNYRLVTLQQDAQRLGSCIRDHLLGLDPSTEALADDEEGEE